MKRERVMVGILAFDNRVNVSLMQMAHELPLVAANPNNRYEFTLYCQAGTRPQEYARNLIIEKFLQSPCDTLLMIDDDMVQQGWTTLKLLDTPGYDIAGPVQLMFLNYDPTTDPPRMPEVFPCAFFRDSTQNGKMVPMWPAPGTKHNKVDAVGSGCIAIKRRVLEDKRMLIAEGYSPPAFFQNHYDPNGWRTRGLDIDFCFRATDLGYRVMVNWEAQIGHLKHVDLNHVEMYAKTQFKLGYEVGAKNALRMAQEQGWTPPGEDRVAGPSQRDNEPLVGVGVDQAEGVQDGP